MAFTATLSPATSASFGPTIPAGLAKWRAPILLAVALAGVLYIQSGDADLSSTADKADEKSVATESATAEQPKARGGDLPPVIALPAIQLSQALQHDPFAPTALLGTISPVEIVSGPPPARAFTVPPEEISTDVNLRQRFKNSPVKMIYQDSQGRKVALIGNRTVHVGDIVEGMRVLDITTTALIVETMQSPAP